jgi:hypothetical protein
MSQKDTNNYLENDNGKEAQAIKRQSLLFSNEELKLKTVRTAPNHIPNHFLAVSRNHILADSQVAVLLEPLRQKEFLEKVIKKDFAPLINFVRTLAGSDANEAEAMLLRVLKGESNKVNDLIHKVSKGDGNVRFGDSLKNNLIRSGFDYETDTKGRPTQRSTAVREAMHGLAKYPSMRDLVFTAGGSTFAPMEVDGTTIKPFSSTDGSNKPPQQRSNNFRPLSSSAISRLDTRDLDTYTPSKSLSPRQRSNTI